MIIAVIPYDNDRQAHALLKQIHQDVDGIELRLDFSANINPDEIARFRRACALPIIFTLRKKSQGGHYQGDEALRLQTLITLCALKPDYVDLEYDTPDDFLRTITARYPNIKLICSYHNFDKTPENIGQLFQSLKKPYFHAYKIATLARSTLDALRMLQSSHVINKEYAFTGICMGQLGECTRILSPVSGNTFHYVAIADHLKTAPTQLTMSDLATIYHYRQLNQATKIYALLGDPIEQSRGHLLHNEAIRSLKQNAVYIKLQLQQRELPHALPYLRSLPFFGLSITMPLKETILPYVDELDTDTKAIGAVNTIIMRNEKWIGTNTDGLGATMALSKTISLAKKKVVLLGAGGAARAIAYEAKCAQSNLLILNRDVDKAKRLAASIGCDADSLAKLLDIKSYDVVINTLPTAAFASDLVRNVCNAKALLSGKIAMDIVYQPKMTPFLQMAKDANCVLVPGYDMYIEQALLQIRHWFHATPEELAMIRMDMQRYFNS